MTELIITTDPFEGAMQRMLAFVRENGKGSESEKVLEDVKKRFCKDAREEKIAEEAYETGELRIFYYPIPRETKNCSSNQDFPNMPARVR